MTSCRQRSGIHGQCSRAVTGTGGCRQRQPSGIVASGPAQGSTTCVADRQSLGCRIGPRLGCEREACRTCANRGSHGSGGDGKGDRDDDRRSSSCAEHHGAAITSCCQSSGRYAHRHGASSGPRGGAERHPGCAIARSPAQDSATDITDGQGLCCGIAACLLGCKG